MLKSFPAVRQAVTAFSEDVLTARDRASVIRFSSGTEVLVSWSNSPEDIRQSLADVQPMRTTSLNDAVIRALLEIHGRRGRKALVLLTDGEDTSSHSTFSDTAWFAHSMRIPIFSITLRNRDAHRMPKFTDEASVRYRHLLSTLTRETGGKAYFRVTIEKLPEVYAEISDILRAQYVVWFRPQSTKDPDSFRSIEVKLSDPKLKVHTISGYYPSR
jgi:Ca-activated chloride channel family protein